MIASCEQHTGDLVMPRCVVCAAIDADEYAVARARAAARDGEGNRAGDLCPEPRRSYAPDR